MSYLAIRRSGRRFTLGDAVPLADGHMGTAKMLCVEMAVMIQPCGGSVALVAAYDMEVPSGFSPLPDALDSPALWMPLRAVGQERSFNVSRPPVERRTA